LERNRAGWQLAARHVPVWPGLEGDVALLEMRLRVVPRPQADARYHGTSIAAFRGLVSFVSVIGQPLGKEAAAMTEMRTETDSLGDVQVPADKLWGAQTQHSLAHFSIGRDLMPREMITAYATLKKACANANLSGRRLDAKAHALIVQVCDEI